jgi:hypothetical protein
MIPVPLLPTGCANQKSTTVWENPIACRPLLLLDCALPLLWPLAFRNHFGQLAAGNGRARGTIGIRAGRSGRLAAEEAFAKCQYSWHRRKLFLHQSPVFGAGGQNQCCFLH